MDLMASLEQMLSKFIMYLPNIAAALVILAIGGLIASGLARLTRRVVVKLATRERLARHGLSATTAPRVAGGIVFWALFIIALGAAADVLQIAVVTTTVGRLVAFVPRFVVAGVMLTIGVALAGWLKRLVTERSTAASPASTRMMGTITQVGVIVLTAFMAVRELDIGASILNTAFVLVIGAFAVAFAISFGLGSRETAGRVARDWYDRSRLRERPPAYPEPRAYSERRYSEPQPGVTPRSSFPSMS